MFENSLFPNEAQEFFRRKSNSTYDRVQAIFKTPDRDIPVFKVVEVHQINLFGENYASVVRLDVFMSIGDYQHIVTATENREELKVELIYAPANESNDETEDPNRTETAISYVAKTRDRRQGVVEGNTAIITDEGKSEISGMNYYTFQLVEEAIYYLKNVGVGQIFSNTTVGNVIRHLFDTESAKIQGDDRLTVNGVDLVTPDNNTPLRTISVEQGVPLVALPSYLQNKRGVYSTGLDVFFLRKQWYVWPTFNTQRFNTTRRVMTIVNVPPTKMPGVEATYFQDSGNLFVLATGTNTAIDNTESNLINRGNGVRYTDAAKVMDGFGESDGNRYSLERANVNSEYIYESRDDRVNNAPLSGDRITSNPFRQASIIAQSNIMTVLVPWDNANPNLVYPGMPVKYLYMLNDEAVTRYGTVYATEFTTSLQNGQLMSNKHRTDGMLTILLERHAAED